MSRGSGLRAVLAPVLVASTTLASGPLDRWLDSDHERQRLPGALREVSGLALDDRHRLWAHDDERGVLYRIADGDDAVVERRVLGPEPVLGDFEGLAWDGQRFHLTSSTGTLVSFAPGTEERVESYTVHRTAASEICEVEGLAYDPPSDRLLLACKTVTHRPWRDHLVVLEVGVPDATDTGATEPLPVRPRILVSPDALDEAGAKPLSPSGITRAPNDDGWWIVAARQRRIVKVDDDGRVVDEARLPSRHQQAEGIVVERGAVLTLVDEGGNGRARITRYERPEPPRNP
ncbi:MAG: hypothetical protein KJP18_17835 [Gemmatimonadetes bacterium]|nr:hypothetical protein [Gemmatimonadota bacterium]